MKSVKKQAIRGAIWTVLGFGGIQVLRFGNNLILTRLLVPEFFGLMALVNTLRVGLELFSDLGIGQSIIHSKRGDDPAFLRTAKTLQVIRGLIVWIVCLILTFPIASFYNDQRFLWLIPIVVLSSVFDGFSSIGLHSLHRRMELGKLNLYELVLQLCYLSSLIVLVWFYPSIWTLGFGVALGGLYKMISSYWLAPEDPTRFGWEPEALNEILSFGKWMFISSGLMFAAEQSDRLVLGKLLSLQMLGVYTVAYTLASIPRDIIRQLSYKVIFPAISNLNDAPRETLRAKILRQRRLMLLGFAVVLASIVTVGDMVIAVLYDNRYAEATWMMPILCCGVWFSILFHTISPALLAIGKPLYSAQSNFARFATITFILPVLYYKFGTLGAIIVIALSDFPLYAVNLYGLWKEKLSCFSQDIQITAFYTGVLALFITIRSYLGFGLPIQSLF
ncbi:oligosaccharide flippase family protein [Scytonema sp. UIC 10036]|uniref:oligosaccharide flippase family protein n=1 Tax=Scytonema sp. UIC 10036 TaxID=2304196 RepID=UPI0012DA560C|nr:oligosaccharide flippase family protein [Scytonema sp. UIC 10036]MUH01187.1 oligosaccharide flippase family protein [Scytonema sp. UIC 10036]